MKAVILIIIIFGYSLAWDTNCVRRWFSSDSFVCVCNASHCDFVGEVHSPKKGTYKIVSSSRDDLRHDVKARKIKPPSGKARVKIYVNESQVYQRMIGFGGAFTDATGINIASLAPDVQNTLVRSYFASEGIEYNIGRIPIAGCDFSTRPYSYDDVPGDVDLRHFSLTEEDIHFKIPYIKSALNMTTRPLLLFGSPWSPPAWMKENGKLNGTGGLLPEYFKPYADYIIKFIKSYETEGIPIWGLTPQNEPLAGFTDMPYNACAWMADKMRDWIGGFLGPALMHLGLKNKVNLMIFDEARDRLLPYASTILEDPVARRFVDGVAVHWYADFGTPKSILDAVHKTFPNKFILYTEACEGSNDNRVDLGSWQRAENYAEDIIEDVNHWSSGWVDWNMALNLEGGPNWVNNFVDSPIIVNKTANEFYKQPMFYSMGHFSKFVSGDSVRIDWSIEYRNKEADNEIQNEHEDVNGIIVAAFANKRGKVVIILNKEEKEEFVEINDVDGTSFEMKIPSHSIHTILYDK